MKSILLLVIILACSSCATIINRPTKKITFHTTERSMIKIDQDTFYTDSNRLSYKARRSSKPLEVSVKSEKIDRTETILPKKSAYYWANVFNYGIGFLKDMKSHKRHTYPSNIYFYPDRVSQVPIPQKGDITFNLSVPYLNSFKYITNTRSKSSVGFLGSSLGLDYYHAGNQFVNINGSVMINSIVPFPAAVDFEGEHYVLSSVDLSISNNHVWNRISTGYGFLYSYKLLNHHLGNGAMDRAYYPTLGLTIPTYYRLGKKFHLGLIYRPTFYRPTLVERFKYEHTISLDLMWKFHF